MNLYAGGEMGREEGNLGEGRWLMREKETMREREGDV